MDNLPPDQKAVLTLVLKRGRSYDEIANLLSIDRAAVRDRALAALDALGPSTRVPAPSRALITDYLLGQLPDRVKEEIRGRLASSASERAWARVAASELAPIAAKPLPEIPSGRDAVGPAEPAAKQNAEATQERNAVAAAEPARAPPASERARAPAVAAAAAATADAATTEEAGPRRASGATPPDPGAQRSSRGGGAILLGLIALIVIAVVVIVIASSGGSNPTPTTPKANTTPAGNTGTATGGTGTGTGTGTTSTTATKPHIIAQVNLLPPAGSSKAVGVAYVVTEGKLTALIVGAKRIAPNSKHNAYAVWLYSPGGAAQFLGYVSPGVGKNGVLKTTGQLPSNYTSYKDLLITRETTTNTKTPGPTVLQGLMTPGG